jgi:hypothetical protein
VPIIRPRLDACRRERDRITIARKSALNVDVRVGVARSVTASQKEIDMFTHRASLHVALLAALITAGCASPIHIIKPDTNPNADPVPQVMVNFLSNFNPSLSWDVSLDGAVLSGFSPAPGPGVTSVVPVSWAQSSQLKSHTVTTHAICGTFCVYNSETVNFIPPHLFYNGTTSTPAGSGNLKQFQPTAKFVAVQTDRSVPINVTIVETGSPKRVKLGLSPNSWLPAGTPLNVTIPATNTKADFFIVGDSTGTYILSFTATGVVPGAASGTITP